MTAEIVIMNKRGVAASADSAVTVGEKTFNDAEKLFNLLTDKPIGILIFNGSEINGIPVELIIKEYRATKKNTNYASLFEYVQDFQKFMKCFIRQHIGAFDPLLGAFDDFLIVSDGLKQMDVIKQNLKDVAPIVKVSKTIDIEHKVTKYLDIRKKYLQPQNLDIKEIVDTFITFVNKSPVSSMYTGFAIFGYGDKDIYPKTYVFHSVGFVTHKIFKTFLEEKHESKDDIIQLAQRDISDMFIFGLPLHLKKDIKTIYNNVVAKIFNSIGIKDPAIKGIVENSLAECSVQVDKTVTGGRLLNLQQSLPHLSLDDLSNLSETLINLECLKNRASLDIESVGGEVKTAIISKYEGFSWKNDKK